LAAEAPVLLGATTPEQTPSVVAALVVEAYEFAVLVARVAAGLFLAAVVEAAVETEIVPSINPVESAERLSMLAAPMAGIPQVRASPVQQVFCKHPAAAAAVMAVMPMVEQE
jgi:hypothetical protein